MTGAEMVTQLGQRTEDPSETKFTSAIKLEALNNNMLRVCAIVKPEYLEEIQVLEAGLTVTTGAMAYTVLANTPLVNGIQNVRIGSSGNFCEKITVADLRTAEDNTYSTATTKSPYYYLYSESIYVLPSATSTIDVYYMKQPTAIADSGTACELAVSLHWMIVNLAEAELFYQINRADRAKAAEDRAFSQTKFLNARPTIEERIK